MKEILILDANAFFSAKQLTDLDVHLFYTTSGIEEEIENNQTAHFVFESLKSQNRLMVADPDPTFLNEVRDTSKLTGDNTVISENDLGIIALALELKQQYKYPEYMIKVVSSDFAIQNICKKKEIVYLSFKHGTIRKQVNWVYACSDCRKKFKMVPKGGECDVCGSKIHRSR